MNAMLEVRGLEINYGHIETVRGIDLVGFVGLIAQEERPGFF